MIVSLQANCNEMACSNQTAHQSTPKPPQANKQQCGADVKQGYYFHYNLILLYLVSRNVTVTLIRYGNSTEKETIKLPTFRINRALNRSCSSRPAYRGSPILEHIEFLYLARLRCCKSNKYINVTEIIVII